MHNPEQYYHAELEAMPRAALEALQLQRLPGTCPCGRTHRRIARLQGRSDDMIILKGVNIFPHTDREDPAEVPAGKHRPPPPLHRRRSTRRNWKQLIIIGAARAEISLLNLCRDSRLRAYP